MPLSSMTGFGRARDSTPDGSLRVEVRSVNGRFLDIQLRLSRSLAGVESKLRKYVAEKIARGSVSVVASGDEIARTGKPSWDRAAAEAYLGMFREIKTVLNLPGEVRLPELLQFGDFVHQTETEPADDRKVWKKLRPVLDDALADFRKSRELEGAHIEKDLRKRLNAIRRTLKRISGRAPARTKAYARELHRRIEQILGTDADPQRMATEVALMAERLDISEECTRLEAHLMKFEKAFEAKEPVGKRMNFLLQEMNREANTIGSKAYDTEIAHSSVVLKEEVEKIREQIQNIE